MEDLKVGRAFDALAKGQQAQIVFRFLEEYLLGRQKQLDHELFITEDEQKHKAIVAQKREAHLFIRNLIQLMKNGEAAGRILSPIMNEAISE